MGDEEHLFIEIYIYLFITTSICNIFIILEANNNNKSIIYRFNLLQLLITKSSITRDSMLFN
jgi:hypothetical protein